MKKMRLFKEEKVAVDWTCVTNGERGEDIGEQTKDGPTKRNIEVYNVGLEGTITDGSTIIRAEATTHWARQSSLQRFDSPPYLKNGVT